MPIKKNNYPHNWKAIALAVKDVAGWTCKACNRPCRKPGEDWDDFKYRLARKSKKLYQECCEKKGRFTLTVSHQNHDTKDNRPTNLKALCSGCHLKYDAKHHAKTRAKAKNKKDGDAIARVQNPKQSKF
jgi:hypothetical protein